MILTFTSGATRDVAVDVDEYPVLGLDADGRVVIAMGGGPGVITGIPPYTAEGYLFGLTLCCNAFDKGVEDGVVCRACYGEKSDDTGAYDAVVVDPIA